MFGFGFAVFLGFLFILIKLPRRWMLRLLYYDAALDVGITLLVLVIHWGSFSGVMAATVAGVLTSLATSAGKRLFGQIHGRHYYPGVFRLHLD